MAKVRERLWIWGQEPNGHHAYNLPGVSKMSALEGACYLGVPNCCRVVMTGKPLPPWDQDSMALVTLKQVVWSVIGSGGSKRNDAGAGDLDEVLRQAQRFPNVTGGVLDDFLGRRRDIFSPAHVAAWRDRLHAFPARPLDLWIVLYDNQLLPEVQPYLDLCDVITFWTWKAELLENLEENFDRFVAMTPGKRRLNGCYMYDYGNRKLLPVELMQRQCELGLRWMRQGRLEGLIFCSNCCADLAMPAVEWTRDWIAKVGEEEVPDTQ
jgi:hypothetical protein